MSTMPAIEQAKGMLMIWRACSADEAFDVLRTISQHTNTKLHDIACVVVAAGSRAELNIDEAELAPAVLAQLRRTAVGNGFAECWWDGLCAPTS